MTRTLALLSLLAALLAPAASAKELSRATVCGSDGCTTITSGDRLEQLPLGGETTLPAPPPTADYFTVDLLVNEGTPEEDRFTFLYVPSKAIIGMKVEQPGSLMWLPVEGEAIGAMTAAIGDLEPYGAPAAWPSEARAAAAAPGGGFDWPLVTGSLIVAFGLVLAAALLARRSALRAGATERILQPRA